MEDHVESSHSTKFDAFRVNRDQVMDLETWFKIHTIVSNVETAPPKPMGSCQTILTLIFYDFCDTLRNGQTFVIFMSASFTWSVNGGILQLSQNKALFA